MFSGKSHEFKADLITPIGWLGLSGEQLQSAWNTTSKDTKTSAVYTDGRPLGGGHCATLVED